MNFEINPGTIYSVWFPFSDLTATKKRPVLALGGLDEYGDVRVGFITKTPPVAASGFQIDANDFEGSPLPYTSHIRIDKTFNLHASRLEKPVAKLTNQGYERALRRLISLDIPLSFLRSNIIRNPFSQG